MNAKPTLGPIVAALATSMNTFTRPVEIRTQPPPTVFYLNPSLPDTDPIRYSDLKMYAQGLIHTSHFGTQY